MFSRGNSPSPIRHSLALRGTAAWNKIAVDTTSLCFDTSPLAAAGVAEAREYMACGVLSDEEIGVTSDIASITFGG